MTRLLKIRQNAPCAVRRFCSPRTPAACVAASRAVHGPLGSLPGQLPCDGQPTVAGRAIHHATRGREQATRDETLRAMLRWLTAGESHGPALVAILEGLPAGVEVSSRDIAEALARRRLGYGRGARM